MKGKGLKKVLAAVMIGAAAAAMTGCSANVRLDAGYEEISQDEAWEMMESGEELMVIDVRTEEEYESGHIKGAVNFPLDSISTAEAARLIPDTDYTVLLYCRSGNRSRKAAERLVELGYTGVKEFGGIRTWKYDMEQD